MPQQHNDEENTQEEEKHETNKKSGLLNQALAAKKRLGSKSVLHGSLDSGAHQQSNLKLPPIPGASSGLKPPTNIKQQNGGQRPPLPAIKSTTSELPKLHSKLVSPNMSSLSNSHQLLTLNSQSDVHSTPRMSVRSNSGLIVLLEKKEQVKKVKEYAKAVNEQFKPKVDQKKKMELEIKRNSVSLDQLELMTRINPIKTVSLADLL